MEELKDNMLKYHLGTKKDIMNFKKDVVLDFYLMDKSMVSIIENKDLVLIVRITIYNLNMDDLIIEFESVSEKEEFISKISGGS